MPWGGKNWNSTVARYHLTPMTSTPFFRACKNGRHSCNEGILWYKWVDIPEWATIASQYPTTFGLQNFLKHPFRSNILPSISYHGFRNLDRYRCNRCSPAIDLHIIQVSLSPFSSPSRSYPRPKTRCPHLMVRVLLRCIHAWTIRFQDQGSA